jgi:hypothetical protein
MRGAHNSLELGPKVGSAATAMRMSDDKHRVPHGPHPGHPIPIPIPVHHYLKAGLGGCAPYNNCANTPPVELCPQWIVREGDRIDLNSPLDCPQPVVVKLKTTLRH